MIDRRKFLTTSVATMSVPMLGSSLSAAAGQARPAFDTLIFDARINGNDALEHVAAVSGMASVAVRGDLAKHWFDSLRSALLERTMVIAGFTSDLDSELMRAFARDVGYQQTQRAELTIDVAAGRNTIRRSGNAAQPKQSKLSSEFENLIDYYTSLATPAHDQRGPAQLVAWAIAPIRS